MDSKKHGGNKMKITLYTSYEIQDDEGIIHKYHALTVKDIKQDEINSILELHNEKVGPIERKLLTK